MAILHSGMRIEAYRIKADEEDIHDLLVSRDRNTSWKPFAYHEHVGQKANRLKSLQQSEGEIWDRGVFKAGVDRGVNDGAT